MIDFLLASWTLWRRETVRFYRQPARVVGAVVPPLIFWLLIGSGLGSSFRHGPDMNYLQYFYPGMIAMIVLFTAIFSTISIIEDRREGFLQSVLVAPVPRSSIVLGKILGGTGIAFAQGLLFVLLAPLVGIPLTLQGALFASAVIFLMAFGLTGLGFWIAWKMDSTQGFHAVMNLFLMPMWFLSSAIFPLEGAPAWLRWAMLADPLTYGVSALRHGFFPRSGMPVFASPAACVQVMLAFCALTFVLSTVSARKRASS